MWFYNFFILIVLLEALVIFNINKSNRNKSIYLTIVFIQLFLISALRSVNIGNDTDAYITLYQNIGNTSNVLSMDTRFEIGYVIFNKILYLINSNSQFLIVVTSLINIGYIAYYIYRESDSVWLSIYILITMRYFYFTMSGLRQAIAITIILIAYKYIKQQKLYKFIFLIFIASLFHSTAIIFIIVYPFYNIKINYKIITRILVLGIIIFFTFNNTLGFVLKYFTQYEHYLSSEYFKGNNLANYINVIVQFIIFLFGYYSISKNKLLYSKLNTNEKKDINLIIYIMIFSVIFSLLAIKASLLDRIALYFTTFNIIFIPNVLKFIKNKKLLVLVIYSILVVCFLYHTIIFIYRPDWNSVFPYEFFWQLSR